MKPLRLNGLYLLVFDENVQIVILAAFSLRGLIVITGEDRNFEYGYWISYQKIKTSNCLIPLDDQFVPTSDDSPWERDPNRLSGDIK